MKYIGNNIKYSNSVVGIGKSERISKHVTASALAKLVFKVSFCHSSAKFLRVCVCVLLRTDLRRRQVNHGKMHFFLSVNSYWVVAFVGTIQLSEVWKTNSSLGRQTKEFFCEGILYNPLKGLNLAGSRIQKKHENDGNMVHFKEVLVETYRLAFFNVSIGKYPYATSNKMA